jgi:hypothetical protein
MRNQTPGTGQYESTQMRDTHLQEALREKQKLDELIESQRKRMLLQKEKLEAQTLRKFQYGGTIKSVATQEQDKEKKRSDKHRYGVLRLKQEEAKLKKSLEKIHLAPIENYDMYMDFLVNEDSKRGNTVKGNADELVSKLMENEKTKKRVF